jgi:hypothetical protein
VLSRHGAPRFTMPVVAINAAGPVVSATPRGKPGTARAEK